MKLKVCAGWDTCEDIAWEVCPLFILARTDASEVAMIPLIQSELREPGFNNLPVDTRAATEFNLTRYQTPMLAAQDGCDGIAVFVDCDFVFIADVLDILKEVDKIKAVSIVHHDFQATETVKMDGCLQYIYPRKNWSSFIDFNCAHPAVRALTPDLVNTTESGYLHQFKWINDTEIGEPDKDHNYLEDWCAPDYDKLKAAHFKLGGWFDHKTDCDSADIWLSELHAYKETAGLEILAWS